MFNRKYYSFERNHYYYGKMLTSKDFESEQRYMNDKRRLMNRTLHGMGVAYGMDVVAADDSSLIIQSGMALDAAGREIVVPMTQVIKLSTIEGYNSLKTDRICLGIAYEEEPSDPVFAVMGQDADGDGREYNHVKEGFRLFLRDRADCVREEKLEDEYIASCILYQDEDIQITGYLPTFAVPGMAVKARIEIRKTSHMPCVCSFSCQLMLEGFEPRSCELRADNVTQEYGETLFLEKSFVPEDYIFGNGNIQAGFTKLELQKSGDRVQGEDRSLTIAPVKGTVLEYVHKNSYNGILDVDLDRCFDEKLWIAEIRLIRSENHSIIDRVDRVPFGQYVTSTEKLMLLQRLSEFIGKPSGAGASEAVQTIRNIPAEGQGGVSDQGEKRVNSSGVFEMSLGSGGEVGKVYFSEEIMHGLGSGPVYVDIGVEYISRNPSTRDDRESIVLGDGSIFASDESVTDEKVFQVDQAVKILPDRGTFIVGVRPRVKMGKIGLRIRWYAFKPEDLEQRVYNSKEQKGCIMIQPDTIVLPPKGSVHINPVFINMPKEALSYTLLDPEGGKVDNNGMYTAPAQEGVYEIKAASLSDPEIYAHAFIIVSQKRAEE